jgi:hypothetical protein
MKICTKCNVEKSFEEFSFRKDQNKYRSDCKECKKKSLILWRKNNIVKLKIYNKKYYNKDYKNNRKKNDILFKFNCGVRNNIYFAFKRGKNQFNKNAKTEIILGCTIEEFINYIQSKFINGMSLENHGDWHLDHIIPLASANTEEDIIKLNHYTNFQPLWAKDNLSKGNKIIEKQLILI